MSRDMPAHEYGRTRGVFDLSRRQRLAFVTMNPQFFRALIGLSLASLLAGCVDPYGRPNYTGSGALVGAGSGALLGAAIDRRNPGAGALIGGAAGLLTGSLIGHGMDEDARRRTAQPQTYTVTTTTTPAPVPAPAPSGPPPSLKDIKGMAKAGVSEDAIVGQIASTRAIYTLDAASIIDLKQAGVSDKVINVMIASSSQTFVSQAPPPPQVETIVVAPGPDYYWCGGEWRWNGVAWIWFPGRYVIRPHSGAVWVEARWVHGPRGWYRVSGRWH